MTTMAVIMTMHDGGYILSATSSVCGSIVYQQLLLRCVSDRCFMLTCDKTLLAEQQNLQVTASIYLTPLGTIQAWCTTYCLETINEPDIVAVVTL